MADEIPTPEAQTEEPNPTTDAPEGAPEGDKPAVEETPEAGNRLEDLPEWAQKEVKNLRAESANYRTKFRDAESRLADAKTPEEFEAAREELIGQVQAAQADAARARLALTHELPDELAALLTGTPEEMEAKAKTLAKHTVAAPNDRHLSGGLTPEGDDDEDDGLTPRELARKYRRNR